MIETWVMTFTLLLIRIASFWFVMPVFARHQVPQTVKIGLSACLAAFWVGILPPDDHLLSMAFQGGYVVLAVAAISEILLGAVLGLAFYLFLLPAQIAGAYVAQELGLSLATLADPATGQSPNMLTTLFQSISILLFFALDFHYLTIILLNESFTHVPVGAPMVEIPSQVMIDAMGESIGFGFAMVAPVAVILFVVLVALLILARAVPAFNLFSIGLSVRLLVGIAAMLFFLPQLIYGMTVAFRVATERIWEMSQML